jgi:predicted RNA-binding Zn-ribbon protein involved in translation (DUF1610 family)
MLTLNIEITGVTTDELVMALEEAKKSIENEYRSGWDNREGDTGSYSFEVSGEEAESVECPECGDLNYITDKDTPDTCINCGADIPTETVN